jgi:hypothetical protein
VEFSAPNPEKERREGIEKEKDDLRSNEAGRQGEAVKVALFQRSNFSEKVFWDHWGCHFGTPLCCRILPLRRRAKQKRRSPEEALSKYRRVHPKQKTVEELDLALKQVEGIQQKLLPGETLNLGSQSSGRSSNVWKNGIAVRSLNSGAKRSGYLPKSLNHRPTPRTACSVLGNLFTTLSIMKGLMIQRWTCCQYYAQ